MCPACSLDDFRLADGATEIDAAAPVVTTAPVSSTAENEPASCTPGTHRCDPAAPQRLQVCDPLTSTGWVTVLTCESAEACLADVGHCLLCTPGEHRCNGWKLEECNQAGTAWVGLIECDSPEKCDSRSVQCSECVSGEAYCSGAMLLACNVNRDGYEATECETADQCNVASMSCRNCFPGEVQCNLEELVRCSDDATWQLVENCGTAARCETSMDRILDDPNAAVECLVDAGCEPGTFACSEHDGRTLLGCPPDGSGFTELRVCSTPEACDAANGTCLNPVCTPGSYQCSGTALQLCSGDGARWETIRNCPAAELCNTAARTCIACAPGDLQCNGNELQRCTEELTWETTMVCASTALCDLESEAAAMGACVDPSCAEGEFRCVEERLAICNPGLDGFTELMSCESADACNAVDGRCDVLGCETAGALRCRGQFLEQCAEDRSGWELLETCEVGTVCDIGILGCSDQCPAQRFRCNGVVPEECVMADDGTIAWRASAAPCATAALCMATAEAASCALPVCGGSLASFRCDPTQPLRIQRCNAARNGWDTDRTCAAGTVCDPGPAQQGPAQCDVCVGGAYRCDDEALTRCELDGQRWTALEPCRDAEHCVATATEGYCLRCDQGDTACDGSRLTTCSEDRRGWVVSQECPAQFGCHVTPDFGDYCNVCAVPNEARCNMATLQTCDAAQRTITQDTPCEFGCQPVFLQQDYCRQCQPNTAQCSTTADDQRRVCSSVGIWETQTCANGSDCHDSGTADYCGSCDPGTFTCTSGTQRQQCSANGTPGAVTTCGASTPVCLASTGGCVQCDPGSMPRCTGSAGSAGRETCSNSGAWQAAACSGSTPVCLMGECRACYPGTSICRGNDPLARDVCSGMGVWQASNCSSGSACWEGDCVECNPMTSEPRCTSSDGPGRETCVEGEWSPANCTGSLVCADGDCLECDPANPTPVCLPSEDPSARQVCADGEWERQDCAAPTPVCGASGQCVCMDGAARCSMSGVRQHCMGGSWVNAPCTDSFCTGAGECVECRNAADCDADFPSCTGGACVCQPGSERCNASGTHQVCSAAGTAWNNVPCTGQTPVCDSGSGTCVCQEGAKRCQSGNADVCVDGAWQTRTSDPECTSCMTDTNCGGNEPICDGIECVACDDDCPDGTVCAANGACVECTPEDASECAMGEPLCSDANLCVECLANMHCSGTTPICDAGDCRACQTGDCGGNICNTQTGACEPCSNANCSGVCVQGACVPCSNVDAGGSVPCPSGTCVNGVCQ